MAILHKAASKTSRYAQALALVAAFVPLLGIAGCTGMVNASNKNNAVQVSPAVVNFGSTGVGKKVSHAVSLTNQSATTVTLTEATSSSEEFTVAGAKFPLVLEAGQKANFTVWFSGSKAGKVSGTLNFSGNNGTTVPVALTGTAGTVTPELSISANSYNFGNVTVNTTAKTALTLTNAGEENLKISSIAVTGASFADKRIQLPLTVASGAGVVLDLTFAPKSTGTFHGSVAIASNDPTNPTTEVSLTGAATTEAIGKLTAAPAALSFSNVKVGTTASGVTVLSNTGNANVTLSNIALSAAGFSTSGVTTPVVMTPGERVSLTVQFTPTSAGTKSGIVLLTNAQGGTTSVSVSGTSPAPTPTPTPTPAPTSGSSSLNVSPATVSFGSVVTGVTNTQLVQISNPSSVSVTISAANVSGAGFSATGLTLPLTLAAGSNTSFSVQFAAKSAGAATGSLALVSTATTPSASVALSATGVSATSTLSVNPSSLSFGNVTVGSTATKSITVTNSGNSNVAISSVGISGAGLTLSGGSAVSLTPSQSVTLAVQFTPAAPGAASGSVSIASNATGSPAAVTVSGTGVAQTQHTVNLAWNASTSASGYNVYRSVTSGSGYTRINAALDATTSYGDNTVQNTLTYFYVTTAVDSNGQESPYSTEVSVSIP
jgi:hypothetical protein